MNKPVNYAHVHAVCTRLFFYVAHVKSLGMRLNNPMNATTHFHNSIHVLYRMTPKNIYNNTMNTKTHPNIVRIIQCYATLQYYTLHLQLTAYKSA